MTDLQYKSLLSFEISLPACKIGKEGIDQVFVTLLKKQAEETNVLLRWMRQSDENGNVVYLYSGAPFSNLSFCNKLVINDNTISYTYEEKTNQQVMLSNILFYVIVLLGALKVAEKVNGSFDKHSIKCHIKIDNNTDCYFYEKYSPLSVNYSRMLKYVLARVADFEMEIEDKDDLFLLVNRFYQQFKTNQSVVSPYVTVNKDSFIEIYDRL